MKTYYKKTTQNLSYYQILMKIVLKMLKDDVSWCVWDLTRNNTYVVLITLDFCSKITQVLGCYNPSDPFFGGNIT